MVPSKKGRRSFDTSPDTRMTNLRPRDPVNQEGNHIRDLRKRSLRVGVVDEAFESGNIFKIWSPDRRTPALGSLVLPTSSM